MYKKIATIYEPFGWGEFSENLFKKLKPLIKKWRVQSHLDLACGTGIFVARLSELGIESSGLDLSRAMIRAARQHYPGLSFTQGNMSDFRIKKPVNLITCNYDSLNHLHDFSDWQKVFKSVYSSLAPKGRFIFDINTLLAINHTDYTNTYQLNDNLMIAKVISRGGYLIFDLEWFLKQADGSYQRHQETIKEVSFPYAQVKIHLKEVGFKNISIINQSINKQSNNSPTKKRRLHILAQK